MKMLMTTTLVAFLALTGMAYAAACCMDGEPCCEDPMHCCDD